MLLFSHKYGNTQISEAHPISGLCKIPRIFCSLSMATLCWKPFKPKTQKILISKTQTNDDGVKTVTMSLTFVKTPHFQPMEKLKQRMDKSVQISALKKRKETFMNVSDLLLILGKHENKPHFLSKSQVPRCLQR